MSDYVQGALDALSKSEKDYDKKDTQVTGETTKKILDSGNRRQFESGAVRDIQEGKGRCDLLPLNEISDFVSEICLKRKMEEGDNRRFHIYSDILIDLNDFMNKGDIQDIYRAVLTFAEYVYKDPFTAIIELSKHYEEGAKKYEERNWERGISCHCFVDSGIRHLTKYFRGDEDEPHERAFLWNMFGLVWTIENRPECNDLLIL